MDNFFIKRVVTPVEDAACGEADYQGILKKEQERISEKTVSIFF
jgi:hypothetical protein